ncbi:hypothetical protein ACFLYR_03595 [Chloroflexota bacterium]
MAIAIAQFTTKVSGHYLRGMPGRQVSWESGARRTGGSVTRHQPSIFHSLFLAYNNTNDRVFSNVDGLITATQEDIDFLIAYQSGEKCHLVLLEAKGVTGFTNHQLQSKIRRLRDIFGNDGNKYSGIIPHFAIVSRKRPAKIKISDWPALVVTK